MFKLLFFSKFLYLQVWPTSNIDFLSNVLISMTMSLSVLSVNYLHTSNFKNNGLSMLITCILLPVLIWFTGSVPLPMTYINCLSLCLTEWGGVHRRPGGLHQWRGGDRSLQPARHHHGSHRDTPVPPLRGVVRVIVTRTNIGTSSILGLCLYM